MPARANVFDGLARIPELPPGSALLVVDRRAETDAALASDLTPLRSMGLDRTVIERGVRVLAAAAARTLAATRPGASRVFIPLLRPQRDPRR